MKRIAIGLALSLVIPAAAFAGGFEVPDNGTEALGRGGAFTAKADDATALQYNLAGLARQRGTRLLFDSNLLFHTYEFQRSGVYPDNPADPATPWGGQPFAKVRNNAGAFYAPFIGVTTDFGILDRWTFAIGLFGPSSIGQRNFVSAASFADGRPLPSRYDVQRTNLLVAYPTLAAAVRATHWLDIGLALHIAFGTFDLSNNSQIIDTPARCKTAEDYRCDATTRIQTNGITATAALGLMFHPLKVLDIGVNLRGPINLKTNGRVNATPPKALPIDKIDPEDASFETTLPWVLRLGARYRFLTDGGNFEAGDIELDGVYEAWHAALSDGDKIKIPTLSFFNDINPIITRHYQDTFSIRLGGSYNLRLPVGVMGFRAGIYYDSPATKSADTRTDFDTLDKVGYTLGLGYTIRGIGINIAYAYVFSPDRTVTDGDIRIINGAKGGQYVDASGNPTAVVNNGTYHAATQILSIGLTLAFDEIIGKKKRVIHYQ